MLGKVGPATLCWDRGVRTIVLIDEDPGVLFWLGRILNEAGFNPLPARSCRHAARLLRQCKAAVDMVILNPALPGSSGFADLVRRQSPEAKIVALLDGQAETAGLPRVDSSCRKPRPEELNAAARELEATAEWLRVVGGMLPGRTQ